MADPGNAATPPPRGYGYRTFNRMLDRIWGYLENRIGISRWPLRPQPSFSFRPAYWTGAFVAIAFILQAISGMLLLIYYNPSAAAVSTGGPPGAWSTTQYIIQKVPFGWMLLTFHLYGAYATIFLACIHFFRGFYVGAYKPPREFSWFFGTGLMISMLAMGFTGYILPYTSLSVGATDVGLLLVSSAAPIGPVIAPYLEGDGTYQGLLSRLFALHVVVIPIIIVVLLYVHITLFETHGIAPPPSSDPKARRTLTHEDDRKLGNWFPRIFLYGTKWGMAYLGFLLLIVAAWPVHLAPAFGAAGQAGVSPEPDWYYLWLYKLADFQGVSPIIAMAILGLIALGILFLPWIDQVPGWFSPRFRNPRTHPRDRPVMLFLATYLFSFFVLMTVWGGVMPSSVIPMPMYVSYLGGIALLDALVVFVFWRRHRVRFADRRATPGGSPSARRAARSSQSARAPDPDGFWNGRVAATVLIVVGLLVPLGYILTLPSYTAEGPQRGLAIALAVMSLSVAFVVHLIERAVQPRLSTGYRPGA